MKYLVEFEKVVSSKISIEIFELGKKIKENLSQSSQSLNFN